MTTPLVKALQRSMIGNEQLVALGFEPARVDALLDGSDPTIDEVRIIAKSLKIPTRSLITDQSNWEKERLHLRENYAASDDAAEMEKVAILTRASDLAVVLPQRAERRFGFEVSDEQRTFESAERLARVCRADILHQSESEPIVNLEERVALYTSAYVLTMSARKIEGSSLSIDGRQFIFLAERGDARMRFTLAHELCHYLVDLGAQDGGWFDDEEHAPAGEYRLAEQFANAFASSLLLPAGALGTALQVFRTRHGVTSDAISDVEVIFLARFFGVNFQVAARRCETLKLLPPGGSSALYRSVVQRYRTPERLADEIGLRPRVPGNWGLGRDLLISMGATAVQNGDVSIGRLAELLGMSVLDLSSKLVAHANLR